MENPTGADPKQDGILRYVVSLERELGKMKRTDKVRFEMEQRYMAIMESDVFLHALLAPDGTFRTMNRRAEKFFGFQPRLNRVTLQSLAGPGCVGEVEAALKDAQAAPVHFPMSVVRVDGALGWLDAEFFAALYQGEPAIQVLAFDITEQVKKKSKEPPLPEQPMANCAAPAEPKREAEPKAEAEEKSEPPVEFLNAIPAMLLIIDGEARCVEANSCFLNALKLDRDAVVGHLFANLVKEDDPLNEQLSERLVRAARGNFPENLECKIYTKDGEVLFLSMKTSRLRWGNSALTLVSCSDSTKLRRTEEQLKRVSTTDTSTGILNRHGFERLLSTETERTERYRGSLALIFLDIDGFRRLNEQIGYAASDHVLRELVTAVKSHIRPTDFIGRWDGDEFLILTPLPLTAACQLAEQIRDMVQHKAFGENNFLTLSAGVAGYRKSIDASTFVGMAYDAMTEAKRSGGNRTVQAKEAEAQAE